MSELPVRVLLYGRDEPLPRQERLRAGPLEMVFEEAGGGLRWIRFGDREVLRRVYVAVRDVNWGTVPSRVSNLHVERGDRSFRLTFDCEQRQGEIDFLWKGTITGDEQGTVSFEMDGTARASFMRNRIGILVLHPIPECAGRPFRAEHDDGSIEDGRFPRFIGPHQPVHDLRAISHEVAPGLTAEVRFSGDVFEMEDQRNWTDASFKTYSTPLRLPTPVEVLEGTRIVQAVTLTLSGQAPPSATRASELRLDLGNEAIGPVPAIGLQAAGHGQALSPRELDRLKALGPSHLRVDLRLHEADYPAILRRAAIEAEVLGVPLEVGVYVSDAADEELRGLAAIAAEEKLLVSAWLVFHVDQFSTKERWIRLARERLAGVVHGAKLGSGSNAYFTQLNRERPPVELLDLVCYSINPQVHAFDNWSMVETLVGQSWTVESARQFTGDVPLAISPITLRPRFNASATRPDTDPDVGQLPWPVDVRQMSLFGAAWTAGSLKYVLESGVQSATYYETSGWRGVMETEGGSPVPGAFRSLPGAVFPLYHVLADVGEFRDGSVVPCVSSDALRVDGLALRRDGETRVLIANLSPERQRAKVGNLGARVVVKRLDETNAQRAMESPEEFRAEPGRALETSGGETELELLPYAVVRVDGDGG
jgi:hypothetical protein